MKRLLENLETIRTVYVVKKVDIDFISWTVTFYDLGHETHPGGNVELMKLASSSLEMPTFNIEIFEKIQGSPSFEYIIQNVPTGKAYYCRISSFNSVGFSKPSQAYIITARSKPSQPEEVINSVLDSALKVSWKAPLLNAGCNILSYMVEWFSGSTTSEIQQMTISASGGEKEIQVIELRADNESIKGSFTLTFLGETTAPIAHDAPAEGQKSLKSSLEALSSVGKVHVKRAFSTVEITQDKYITMHGTKIIYGMKASNLQSVFKTGEKVVINNHIYEVESVYNNSFTISEQYDGPSSDYSNIYKWTYGYTWEVTFLSLAGDQESLKVVPLDCSGVNLSIVVSTITQGRDPMTGYFQLVHKNRKTMEIPHNANAIDIEVALEALPDIRDVTVSSFVNSNGQVYFITFSSVLGDVPLLGVEHSNLHGTNVHTQVTTIQNGAAPSQYGQKLINPVL
jgi:hypothetical protein